MSLGRFAAAALVAAAPMTVVDAAPARKAAAIDWTKKVGATPEGGFRLGNPNAAVKLVEYGSLTCGHCRNFAAAAKAPLMSYIRSGKVSFEFRNYVLNGIDVTASLVARCAGPARFFPVVDELYDKPPQWVSRIADLPDAEKDKLKALPEGIRLVRLAEIGGIKAIAARHGLPAAKANACLADSAALDRLGQMAETAAAAGINGTPAFLINGKLVETNVWEGVERLLKEAGA